MKSLWVACALLTGCATDDAPLELDGPQDADPSDELKGDVPAQSCTTVKCGNAAADAILFPGNLACGTGCERRLASDKLYIPPRNSRPWGDTYDLGYQPARVLSGYSAGRIALLRRLALVGDGEHAVMLDPSWADGARDFLGEGPVRGETIVANWLRADPARTFTIIYSKSSIGYANYVALQSDSAVRSQVRVCQVTVPHYLVPAVKDVHVAVTDPLAWDNGTCKWGE